MSRELRICPGVGGRKCGAFLSSLDRDPHPTCARCRGKISTRDFCVGRSRGAPGVASREASSPPTRPQSSEGWKCLWTFICCAPLSLQLLREPQRGRLLGCSGLPLPAPLPRLLLPHSLQHVPRRDELREVTVDRSLSRSSRVSRYFGSRNMEGS